jgi:transposase
VRVYPREAQEMVFDAHDRAFALFKGACQRGIYDNMKTAARLSLVAELGRLRSVTFRTTFREMPNSRQIALIGLPWIKNARRIFAIVSTISIPTRLP